jgi:hypothetical protein
MEISWKRNPAGNVQLSVLTGFGLGVLSEGLIAVQLRTALSPIQARLGRSMRFQLGMNATGARELAAALLEAADALDNAPASGKLN